MHLGGAPQRILKAHSWIKSRTSWVAAIDAARQSGNLSSAIRLFVLDFYCHQVSVEQEERDGKTMVLIKRRAHGGSATADDAAG